jgi:hypothetical protein
MVETFDEATVPGVEEADQFIPGAVVEYADIDPRQAAGLVSVVAEGRVPTEHRVEDAGSDQTPPQGIGVRGESFVRNHVSSALH